MFDTPLADGGLPSDIVDAQAFLEVLDNKLDCSVKKGCIVCNLAARPGVPSSVSLFTSTFTEMHCTLTEELQCL